MNERRRAGWVENHHRGEPTGEWWHPHADAVEPMPLAEQVVLYGEVFNERAGDGAS